MVALDRSPSIPTSIGYVDLHEVLRELRIRHPTGTHIAAAVDGSEMSDRAAQIAGQSSQSKVSRNRVPPQPLFACAVRFVDTRHDDSFSVFHISDPTKLNLPKNLDPNHLKSHYKVLRCTTCNLLK